MIFIGGISQGEKQLNYTQTVICDICAAPAAFLVHGAVPAPFAVLMTAVPRIPNVMHADFRVSNL